MSHSDFDLQRALSETFAPARDAMEQYRARTAPGNGLNALGNDGMMLFHLFELQPPEVLEETLEFALAINAGARHLTIVCVLRALAHWEGGSIEDGLAEYSRLLAVTEGSAELYASRASMLAAAGMMNEARRDVEHALALDPHSASGYLVRGTLHEQQGGLDAALRDFGTAIEAAPDEAAGYQRRGSAHLRAGNLERAIDDLSRAVDLDPADGDAHLSRALAYTMQAEYGLAMRDYSRAAEVGAPGAEEQQALASREFFARSMEELWLLSSPSELAALVKRFPFLTTGDFVAALRAHSAALPYGERLAWEERIGWLESI
jgi:tetratricopeptide (TPR) repeat protein